MTSRHFCPNCDAVPRPRARFCASCGAPVEHRLPHVALMLLAYLACAPLAAYGTAIAVITERSGSWPRRTTPPAPTYSNR
jgi:hypothetical protein